MPCKVPKRRLTLICHGWYMFPPGGDHSLPLFFSHFRPVVVMPSFPWTSDRTDPIRFPLVHLTLLPFVVPWARNYNGARVDHPLEVLFSLHSPYNQLLGCEHSNSVYLCVYVEYLGFWAGMWNKFSQWSTVRPFLSAKIEILGGLGSPLWEN